MYLHWTEKLKYESGAELVATTSLVGVRISGTSF